MHKVLKLHPAHTRAVCHLSRTIGDRSRSLRWRRVWDPTTRLSFATHRVSSTFPRWPRRVRLPLGQHPEIRSHHPKI